MSTQLSSKYIKQDLGPAWSRLTSHRMLYDFHRTQNAKRPGAVHATYLVYGTKKPSMDTALESPNGDGDVEMTGSAPERDSVVESIPTSTLTLVPEDQLKGLSSEWG
jgi:DNA polymerase delta subunit 3